MLKKELFATLFFVEIFFATIMDIPLMTFRKPAETLREAELSPHVSLANLQELNAQTTVHASDARILAREDIVLTKTRQTTKKLIVSLQQAR